MIGPNVKRLLFTKMAKDAIPDGGGLAAGVHFLSKKENISAGFKTAREWTEQVIRLVREAEEPNPWKDASDEEIAGELLRRIEERKQGTHA